MSQGGQARAFSIRVLGAADLPAADRLREQAGWNQTVEDWGRLLAWEPELSFGAVRDGDVLATVTATRFGGARQIAWVGMMLVDASVRRQGLGRTLLAHALDRLDACGVQTVGLDATPLGKTLYDGMGFSDVYTLRRRRGTVPPVAPPDDPRLRPLASGDLPRLADLDASVFFGADRMRVLRDLVSAHAGGCWLAEAADGSVAGYVLTRPGVGPWYLGPLVARDPSTADALLRRALAPLGGESVVVDTPDPNAEAGRLAERYGFEPQRPFIRMARGRALPEARTGWCYAIAGPEIG